MQPPVPPATAAEPPAQPAPPLPPGNDSGGDERKRISFGPEVGVYFPTSSKTSKAFGSAWFNYGAGIGAIHAAKAGGQYQLDIGLFGTSRAGHQVFMAPLGVSYRRAFSDNVSASPYYGASLDAFLTQIRSDPDGVVSRIRGTEGGSVFVGENFRQTAYVQARYLLLGSVRGFNLSGLNLSTGYRF